MLTACTTSNQNRRNKVSVVTCSFHLIELCLAVFGDI